MTDLLLFYAFSEEGGQLDQARQGKRVLLE
jgi:hypothetical protein